MRVEENETIKRCSVCGYYAFWFKDEKKWYCINCGKIKEIQEARKDEDSDLCES